MTETFSEAARALAPWSVSKAKLAKTCPLAWKLKYRDHLPEVTTLPTRVGTAAHSVLEHVERGETIEAALEAARLEHDLSSDELTGMIPFLAGIRRFAETIAEFRARTAIARELCEERLGLDENLEPAGFSDDATFFRGALDLGFVLEDGRIAIVDHKTSKKKDLKWHSEQLRSYAILALAHFQDLRKVWPAIHFVGAAEVVWAPPATAEQIRGAMRTWFVRWINQAAELARTADPQPVVSRFCDHCGYRPQCPAHTMEAAGERLVQISTGRAALAR